MYLNKEEVSTSMPAGHGSNDSGITEAKGDAVPEISVVIPCYNTEKSLPELHQRLVKALNSLGTTYEILYVNDASTDRTAPMLKELAEGDDTVTAYDLMFNVGQFRALICGLEHTRGRFVVTMDDDLQHPPEEIEKLYRAIRENDNLDAVIGKYIKKNHSPVRNMGSWIMLRLRRKKHWERDIQITSFRCIRRSLVEALTSCKILTPAIGMQIMMLTDRVENVLVDHHARKTGSSNYSYIKLFRLVFNNLFNFSSLPLKFISASGILVSLVSFIMVIYYLFAYLLGRITIPGWTTLVLFVNLYAGLILLSVGIIGEYMIRILRQVSGFPRYYLRNIYRKHEPIE